MNASNITAIALTVMASYIWLMRLIFILPVVAIAGCASILDDGSVDAASDIDRAGIASAVAQANRLVVTAPTPPVSATSVEDFDTTTQLDRDAAATEVADEDAPLGVTIASLGAPTDPGIWMKTPLVTVQTAGRVAYQGNAITIELRPSGGAAGSGSEMSLAAMRLLNAPLAGLPKVTVFASN